MSTKIKSGSMISSVIGRAWWNYRHTQFPLGVMGSKRNRILSYTLKWDLVCDRASLVELSQTVMMIGVMVGSFAVGYLADRFGRKTILFTGLFAQGVVGILQALSPSMPVFIFIRFFVGILDQSYELPAYSMASELFTPRCRPYAFISLLNFWATGLVTLSCLAYLIRDWRYLQLAISVPVLFLPLFYWVVPESPRWLLSVGRYEEASRIVTAIARLNGRKSANIEFSDTASNWKSLKYSGEGRTNFPGNKAKEGCPDRGGEEAGSDVIMMESSEMERLCPARVSTDHNGQTGPSSNSYFELFRGYYMSVVTVVMATLWFASSLSYYGQSLNAGNLVGDPHLNVFLSGIVEIPAHILATMVVVWFGRRWPICISRLAMFTVCVVFASIPETTDTGLDLTVAVAVTAAAGKFAICIPYAIVILYATEMFPTILRNRGIAFVSISARVGAMMAPFVLLLDSYLSSLPIILFGSATVVPGLLTLLLPEMKGRPQPQTIADLESIFRDDRRGRK